MIVTLKCKDQNDIFAKNDLQYVFEEAINEFREELIFPKILGRAVSKFKDHL